MHHFPAPSAWHANLRLPAQQVCRRRVMALLGRRAVGSAGSHGTMVAFLPIPARATQEHYTSEASVTYVSCRCKACRTAGHICPFPPSCSQVAQSSVLQYGYDGPRVPYRILFMKGCLMVVPCSSDVKFLVNECNWIQIWPTMPSGLHTTYRCFHATPD